MPTNKDMNISNHVAIDDSWNKIMDGDVNESAYAHDELAGNNVSDILDKT